MNPEYVVEIVLGRQVFTAMQCARQSWPIIVQQTALELLIRGMDKYASSEYDTYVSSIRKELLRLGL